MDAEEKAPDRRPPTRFARLRKILIVDKDKFWGPSIRLALEECGYYLNLVAEPREGCRRVLERAYDVIILSASVGTGAVHELLDRVARRDTPPAVIVLAGADELRRREEVPGAPALMILRRPCAVEDVVDSVRELIGSPWTDHRKGA